PPELGVVGFALDELEEARPEAVRGDQEAPEAFLARQAGQDVEQVGDVGAELVAAREQAQVGVLAGGPWVVVPGADVGVAPHPAAPAPAYTRELVVCCCA